MFFNRNTFMMVYEGFVTFKFLFLPFFIQLRVFINLDINTFHDFVSICIQTFISFSYYGVSKQATFLSFSIQFSFTIIFQNVTFSSKYIEIFYTSYITKPQLIRCETSTFIYMNLVQGINNSTHSFIPIFQCNTLLHYQCSCTIHD